MGDNLIKGNCFSGLILGFVLGLFGMYNLGNILDNVTSVEDNIEGFRLQVGLLESVWER